MRPGEDEPPQRQPLFARAAAALQDAPAFRARGRSLGIALEPQLPQQPQPQQPIAETPLAAARRARAETFSAFPSHAADQPAHAALSDANHLAASESGPPAPSAFGIPPAAGTPVRSHNRVRTGSLSIPKNSIADAFGPGLFATNWTPAAVASHGQPIAHGGQQPQIQTQSSHLARSSAAPGAHIASDNQDDFESADTNALARTLDYLGLDDPIFDSQPNSPAQKPAVIAQQNSIHTPIRETKTNHRSRSISVSFAENTNVYETTNVFGALQGISDAHAANNILSSPASHASMTPPSTNMPLPGSRLRSSTISFIKTSRAFNDILDQDEHEDDQDDIAQPSSAPHAEIDHAWDDAARIPAYVSVAAAGVTIPQYNIQSTPHTPADSHQQEQPKTHKKTASIDNSAKESNDASNAYSDPSNPEVQPASRSLWVGNYDPSLSHNEIMAIFTRFGPVDSLRMLPERECIFVHFQKLEDAVNAKQVMQGSRMGNCIVRVGFGKPESVHDPAAQQPTKSLWIGNISNLTTPADLESAFSVYGPIESARVLAYKNCGFVNFVNINDAITARVDMNGKEFNGTAVKIGFAKVPGTTSTITTPSSVHISPSLMNTTASTSPTSSVPTSTQNHSVTSSPWHRTSHPASHIYTGQNISASNTPGPSVPATPSAATTTGDDSPARQSSGSNLLNAPGGAVSAWPSLTRDRGVNDQYQNGQPSSAYPQQTQYAARAQMAPSRPTPTKSQTEPSTETTSDDEYTFTIPNVPMPRFNRRVDPGRLREIRRRLDVPMTQTEIDNIYHEIIDEAPELCADYIGNVVIQKVVERTNENNKLVLYEKVSPHLAALGIHKNGTWAVQKMIDCCKTSGQITAVVNGIRPYTPPLLLDQFGNYVVQCCLRLGSTRNQFIFDAIAAKMGELGVGRFGARAIRACLESQHTTKRQQKQVAVAIVNNTPALAMNPNGAILVTWLMDTSSLPGRYRVLAPVIVPYIVGFCNHKLASACVLKLVSQRVELDARAAIIDSIFHNATHLKQILSDPVHGVSVIQKILASGCTSTEERIQLADCARSVLAGVNGAHESLPGYKRLMDELATIPTGGNASQLLAPPSASAISDIVSPLTPHAVYFIGAVPSAGNPGSSETQVSNEHQQTTLQVPHAMPTTFAQVASMAALNPKNNMASMNNKPTMTAAPVLTKTHSAASSNSGNANAVYVGSPVMAVPGVGGRPQTPTFMPHAFYVAAPYGTAPSQPGSPSAQAGAKDAAQMPPFVACPPGMYSQVVFSPTMMHQHMQIAQQNSSHLVPFGSPAGFFPPGAEPSAYLLFPTMVPPGVVPNQPQNPQQGPPQSKNDQQ